MFDFLFHWHLLNCSTDPITISWHLPHLQFINMGYYQSVNKEPVRVNGAFLFAHLHDLPQCVAWTIKQTSDTSLCANLTSVHVFNCQYGCHSLHSERGGYGWPSSGEQIEVGCSWVRMMGRQEFFLPKQKRWRIEK